MAVQNQACGGRGFHVSRRHRRHGVRARRRPRRLGPWLGRRRNGAAAAAAGAAARPPAHVRFGRVAARPAQADRRSAAPRLRPHPRDRGADPRRLCAEPGHRLSDAHHAPGHGPDRGGARARGRARPSRSPPRARTISPRKRRRSRPCSSGSRMPAATSARPAARRSSARSAICSRRCGTAPPARTCDEGDAAQDRRDPRRGGAEDRTAEMSLDQHRHGADRQWQPLSAAALQALGSTIWRWSSTRRRAG